MLKEIKIGDRIVLFGKLYRILIKHRGLILMIEMNVDKMIFRNSLLYPLLSVWSIGMKL